MMHELDAAINDYAEALAAYDAAVAALDEVTGIGANPVTVIYPLAQERDRRRRNRDNALDHLNSMIQRNRR